MDQMPVDLHEHGIRIRTLENDFAEVKSSLVSLSNKLDESYGKLSTMISARDKTPWGTITGMGSILLVIVAGFGSLALNPIKDEILSIKTHMVPREETEGITRWVTRIENRQWEASVETMKALRLENDNLRRKLIEGK